GGGAVLNNEGTIRTLHASGIRLATGTGTINNSGTFRVDGDSMAVRVTFNNAGGAVEVRSGDLLLAGSGQSSGSTFELTDDATLTVTDNLTWTGGAMTSGGDGVGTTTVAADAALFIFEPRSQRASNRQITISQGANAYLFASGRVAFQGGVVLSNAGRSPPSM